VRLEDDLTCKELVELVTDYHEGVLSARDRQRFEEHVVFCDGCASFLDGLRVTIDLTGRRLTEEDLLPELQEELVVAFRGWKRE
jgi:hypothetical protein